MRFAVKHQFFYSTSIEQVVLSMNKYVPISCEFHSLLEALATTRKNAEIEYLDAEGKLQTSSEVILDVYAVDKEEYLKLGTGEKLRLDQLVAVNGAKLIDF